jgi:hypothetical protein
MALLMSPGIMPLDGDLLARYGYGTRAQVRRDAAEERSWLLFKSKLTQEQLETLAAAHWILVRGSRGGWYRISCVGSRTGNVHRHSGSDGKLIAMYCGGPTGNLPYGDFVLAQKLLLEADEEAFLRVAIELKPAPRIIPTSPLSPLYGLAPEIIG